MNNNEPLVFPFAFVEWYSGMSSEKIERAWKRYQSEQSQSLPAEQPEITPEDIIEYIDSKLKGPVIPLNVERDAIKMIKEYANQPRKESDIINLAKSCLFLGRRGYSNIQSDEDCWKDFMSRPENVELLNKALK